jgi:hypothetical protein
VGGCKIIILGDLILGLSFFLISLTIIIPDSGPYLGLDAPQARPKQALHTYYLILFFTSQTFAYYSSRKQDYSLFITLVLLFSTPPDKVLMFKIV